MKFTMWNIEVHYRFRSLLFVDRTTREIHLRVGRGWSFHSSGLLLRSLFTSPYERRF